MKILWILFGIVVVLYLIGREFLRFIFLPAVAQSARSRGKLPIAIRILERVVSSWSLFGEALRSESRFELTWLYLEAKRPEAAVLQCRKCLQRQLKPASEAKVRSRLADCLEAVGKSEEADAERKIAAERLDSAPEDAMQFVTKGEALNRERRFAEAAAAFEKAVSIIPSRHDFTRGKVLVQAALAHFEAGNAEQAILLGKETLRFNAGGTIRIIGNSVIAKGYGNQGDLEQSEKYYQER